MGSAIYRWFQKTSSSIVSPTELESLSSDDFVPHSFSAQSSVIIQESRRDSLEMPITIIRKFESSFDQFTSFTFST